MEIFLKYLRRQRGRRVDETEHRGALIEGRIRNIRKMIVVTLVSRLLFLRYVLPGGLLSHTCDMNVHLAEKDIDSVKRCIQQGKINLREKIPYGDVLTTPLHVVVGHCIPSLVSFMLENGAEVESLDGEGRTPLTIAVLSNCQESAAILIANSANLEARTNGATPLHLAAHHHFLEMASFLLDHEANVNAIDETGLTPLLTSIRYCDDNMASLFISRGALLDAKHSALIPLHFAVYHKRHNVVVELLAMGADPELTFDEETALDIGFHYSRLDRTMLVILLNNGATLTDKYSTQAMRLFHEPLLDFYENNEPYHSFSTFIYEGIDFYLFEIAQEECKMIIKNTQVIDYNDRQAMEISLQMCDKYDVFALYVILRKRSYRTLDHRFLLNAYNEFDERLLISEDVIISNLLTNTYIATAIHVLLEGVRNHPIIADIRRHSVYHAIIETCIALDNSIL